MNKIKWIVTAIAVLAVAVSFVLMQDDGHPTPAGNPGDRMYQNIR